MATEAQILANRANARKSTGPRTVEGKEKVAQNALKHGLFSQKNVVISENQVEYDLLEEEMLEELAPVGVMETMLAERIVSLMWRLKRAERMQNEFIDMQIMQEMNSPSPYLTESLITGEPQERPGKYDDVVLGFVADRDFGGDRTLERLAMYERRFELSLYKTMAEFKKLQKARKAQDAKFKTRTIPKAYGFEDATYFEGVPSAPLRTGSPSKRGQDARDTTGDLKKQTQIQSTGWDEYETSEFEKKEHELLTGHVN